MDGKFGLFTSKGAASDTMSLADIDPALLQKSLAADINIWQQWGLPSKAQLALIQGGSLRVAELTGSLLASTKDSIIQLDRDAAGHGWFSDSTPSSNEGFIRTADGSLDAPTGSVADGQMDLLTVLLHELGLMGGLDHEQGSGLMAEVLGEGTRRLPTVQTTTSTNPTPAAPSNGSSGGSKNGVKGVSASSQDSQPLPPPTASRSPRRRSSSWLGRLPFLRGLLKDR